MAEREATQFVFEDVERPVSEENFADIELALNSLRAMVGEYLVVVFKEKLNNLDFIQACSNESYKLTHVELVFLRDGKDFPLLMALDDISVKESIKIFKSVCCSRNCPDTTGWTDITDEIMSKEGINES